MDPIKELQFLNLLEDQDQYAGLVKLVYRSGSTLCQVLGNAEALAEEKLNPVMQYGEKYFQAAEVERLFTGIIIKRVILG